MHAESVFKVQEASAILQGGSAEAPIASAVTCTPDLPSSLLCRDATAYMLPTLSGEAPHFMSCHVVQCMSSAEYETHHRNRSASSTPLCKNAGSWDRSWRLPNVFGSILNAALQMCRKLGQELATAKEAARISSSRNRSAVNTLRSALNLSRCETFIQTECRLLFVYSYGHRDASSKAALVGRGLTQAMLQHSHHSMQTAVCMRPQTCS